MPDKSPIAIVGIGGIFPGASDLDGFWQNVVQGKDSAREVDDDRWILSKDDAFAEAKATPDKVYSTRGCLIDAIPKLPAHGLEISPELVAELDPAVQLLLAAGHQAFYDARVADVDRSRVGVMIGNLALPSESSSTITREFFGRILEEKVLGQSTLHNPSKTSPMNRYVAGLPAGVLANALGLGGGSFTLDAACSSSLYALKLAIDELQSGRADAMLTGGLSRPDCLYTQMGFSQLHALSPTGTCSPFDQNGNGLVVGEGCGILLLKRLDDAQRDGDTIHAVIRGIGLSNDVGGSLLAPMTDGQLRAMHEAYENAGLRPQDMDHVECHATGTPLGDATEVRSLKALWGGDHWQPEQCVLGSVKSNIGHLLTAAGSAAIIKTILAMKHRTLPPTANFKQPNPEMELSKSPFAVLSESKTWEKRDKQTPRRAAVSAFGFGGINAHVILEEWDPEFNLSQSRSVTPIEIDSASEEPVAIAVVGMDASFGQWDTLRAFQERVLGGRNEDEPTTPSGWWGIEQSAWYRLQGLNHTPFKGFYSDTVEIPRDMFRIPPKELEEMLPQQLLMLKVAARALIDSGLNPKEAASGIHDKTNERTGVFIGIGMDLNATNFSFRWSLANKAKEWARQLGLSLSPDELDDWIESLRDAFIPPLSANRTMGALGSVVASRIAREFRIGGPSYTISSEENSSARAIEVAVRALQSGSLDQAVAGGVDLNGDMRSVLTSHQERAYSPSGTCRPFDAQADGSLVGEGAAAVVLKRLDDAVRDGDRVYAVIKGIGTASGGGVESSTPTESAYTDALKRAYADAQVEIDSVGLIEASGSGSPDEDYIESRALSRSFKENDDGRCMVTSAKADIGHAGAASGIASLVKTCLSLYQEILPPLRGIDDLREEFQPSGHRLFCSKKPQYWLRNSDQGPLRAGVSSFGFDGNCTHMVLESFEYKNEPHIQTERLQPLGSRAEGLFFVEANNVQALEIGLGRLRAFIERDPEAPVEILARRWWHDNREDNGKALAVAFVARNGSELVTQIDFAKPGLRESAEKGYGLSSRQHVPPHVRDRVFFNANPLGAQGKVAFVYPGSGNQYLRMGQDLSVQWPEIFREQSQDNATLKSQFQPDVFWNSESATALNENHKATLFGQVALGTAVSDLIFSFGVKADAVLGYSLGEMAGFFSLKAWTQRDEMHRRIEESTLFTEDLAGEYKAARKLWKVPSNTTVDWALGVIDRPAKVVRAALTDHKKVYNLIVNTLHECVVGGDPHAVEKLVKKLDCEFFPLQGVTTVHCEVAEEVQEPYRELHVLPTTQPRDVQFYSGAWGTAYNLTSDSAADSVLAQALYGIDYPKVVEAAYDDGARIFIEMGPGGSCSRMIGEILGDRPYVARTVCKQGQEITTTVLRTLGQLIAERVPVDLSVLYGQETTIADPALDTHDMPMLRVHTGGDPIQVVMPHRETTSEPIDATPIYEEPEPAPASATPAPEFEVPVFAAPAPVAVGTTDPAMQQWLDTEEVKVQAHETYLRFAQQTTKALEETIAYQLSLTQALMTGAEIIATEVATTPAPPAAPPPPSRSAYTGSSVAMTREQCMEYAIGSIGASMGQEWREIDSHPTRVRLPDEPLMLVDRIISFHGDARSMTNGRVVTEHDILPNAWYLDCGRIPTCIAVEAGQADLVLSAYLGIDFETKGLAMYRLLDADVTFHRSLPGPGETIHFDIRIERFFQQGDTYLFKFNYDATVNGESFLTMRNGCAGFFTREELDAGQGVVKTELDLRPMPGVRPDDWRDLVPMRQESYSDAQVTALRGGDYVACFGDAFSGIGLNNPAGLPDGKMCLVERITDVEPGGGRFGLGLIRGEMDIHPDDWFLTCHFVDDRVMPGTLMYECSLHTMRIYLMRMGWVGEADSVVYEPVPGVTGKLKCRGEVNESSDRVIYEITIKELGYNPSPYAIADTMMYVDGKPAVEMNDLSIQMTGWTRESLETMWERGIQGIMQPRQSLFDYESILAFSSGKPSEAFGDRYKIFDEGRIIARLPRPPFQFLDRIMEVNAEQWVMKAGGTIVSEYDVPSDEWYFDANRQELMPFSVLLEIALQPCGWLAAYIGSALTSDVDLHFRNLGGKATHVMPVGRDVGTLGVHVKCTGVSSSGGMIIQHYDYEVKAGAQTVYIGNTYFGYFSDEALANQVGFTNVQLHEPTEAERTVTKPFDYPKTGSYPDEQMRMIDTIEIFDPLGGDNGLGFIRGTLDVNPDAWFFKAHFYQDPVCPGSLGLESFLQLVNHVAIERWAVTETPRIEALLSGCEHEWGYRGQVIPKDKRVTVEATITGSDDATQTLTAEGFLCVDGRIIYQMKRFSVQLKPGT
ncbi:MAG: beta-ketoacyl synthase N-terminal-like domain-containing protein [Candidatus Hydrogenedentota bacterium]